MTPTQQLLKREYGTMIFDLARRLTSLDDREERTRQAQLVVNLMLKINQDARQLADPQPTLWHHMLMMGAGEIDVDCPFELPVVGPDDMAQGKPERLDMRLRLPKTRHYGRHLETLVQQASRLTDPEEREGAIISVGRLMKAFYRTYNKDVVADAVILKDMNAFCEGKLMDIPLARIEAERLFDSAMVAGNGPGQPLNDASRKFGKKGGGGGGGGMGKKRKR
jgi:hypothetical protein